MKILVVFLMVLVTPLFASLPDPVLAQVEEPFFTIVVGCPDNDPDRILWTEMIAESFREANIDAQFVVDGWGFWMPRVLFPSEEDTGKPFAEGGWDTFSLGMSFDWDYIDDWYHSSHIPLFNYPLWEDETNDFLIEQMNLEIDDFQRNLLVQQWQQNFLEESPKATIYYPERIWAHDPDLMHMDSVSYLFPNFGDPHLRFPGGDEEFKVGVSADPMWFNPLFSTSVFDLRCVAPCYEKLFTYMDNDAYLDFQLTPALTTGPYEVSDDGRIWTIHLRDDIYWPTGFRFNASDLCLTYQAISSGDIISFMSGHFDKMGVDPSSVEILDEFTVQVTLPEPYAWAKFALNVAPISYVVLKDIPFADWKAHGSNTGAEWLTTDVYGNPYQVFGPLGLGPYVCHEPDTGWETSSRRFVARRRDLVTGFGDPLQNPDPGYFNGAMGWGVSNMPTSWNAVIIASQAAAISALESDVIDLIDHYFLINDYIEQIDPLWGTVLIDSDFGNKQVGFNMRHPILGTGEATPLGRREPNRASEAARYVRQALNYLIPRQRIIDEILGGFGTPGVTTIHPEWPAYDPTMDPYEYDPVRAAKLLAMAGYGVPSGVKVKLSGNFDYPIRENVQIQLAALVTDPETGAPISGAAVTLRVFDPNHNQILQTTMIEVIPESGVYLYTTPQTIRQMRLSKGIYLAHVEAVYSIDGWEVGKAVDIIQFHIDPPGSSDVVAINGIVVPLMLGLMSIGCIGAHGLLVWRRRFYRKGKRGGRRS